MKNLKKMRGTYFGILLIEIFCIPTIFFKKLAWSFNVNIKMEEG